MTGFSFRRPMNISGPEELARRREIARAMMAKNAQIQPKNLWEGLNSLATSIGERNSLDRLDAAEAEGRASGDAAYQPIVDALKNKGTVDNDLLINAMGSDWLTDPRRTIVGALFKSNMDNNAPLTPWQKAQLDLDKERNAQWEKISPYQQAQIDSERERNRIAGVQNGRAVKTQLPVSVTPSKAPINGAPAAPDGSRNAFASDPQFGHVVSGHKIGATATNPETGEKIIWDGNGWRPR